MEFRVVFFPSKWLRGSESQARREHSAGPAVRPPQPREEGRGGASFAGRRSGSHRLRQGLELADTQPFQEPAALKGSGSSWAVGGRAVPRPVPRGTWAPA